MRAQVRQLRGLHQPPRPRRRRARLPRGLVLEIFSILRSSVEILYSDRYARIVADSDNAQHLLYPVSADPRAANIEKRKLARLSKHRP
jgi:hypothetical protein